MKAQSTARDFLAARGVSLNATGCGATALAQVLYYHRERSKAQGITTLQETTSTYTISWGTDFSPAPQQKKGSPIDWDNMIDDYKAGATSAQKEAVARLMIYCGAAIKMGYSNNGSGSLPEDVPAAVVKYFGYDGACAYKNKASFSIRAWDDMVYNEMVNHRPVVFSGTDAMIAASPRIQVSTSELSFVGTTTQATAENAFVLNEAGDNFDYAATTNVKPFSAYFRDKAAQPGAGSITTSGRSSRPAACASKQASKQAKGVGTLSVSAPFFGQN